MKEFKWEHNTPCPFKVGDIHWSHQMICRGCWSPIPIKRTIQALGKAWETRGYTNGVNVTELREQGGSREVTETSYYDSTEYSFYESKEECMEALLVKIKKTLEDEMNEYMPRWEEMRRVLRAGDLTEDGP